MPELETASRQAANLWLRQVQYRTLRISGFGLEHVYRRARLGTGDLACSRLEDAVEQAYPEGNPEGPNFPKLVVFT